MPRRHGPLLALALIAGCALPRQQTVLRHEAPPGAGGQACARQCETARAACQAECGRQYQACIKSVEPRVEDAYTQALERYEAALDDYRRELEHYEFQPWAGWYRDPWWTMHGWHQPGYGPRLFGPLPERPTRESVRAALLEQRCAPDCGCQPAHDQCFVACGGRLIPETRCVANCPAKAAP